MISRIRGTLVRRELGLAEVMTSGGVGYELQVPIGVYERLPAIGSDVELRTHHVVREDAAELFGFLDDIERAVFGRLLTASGVGPKLALSILSTLSPQRIVRAIVEKDYASLRQIPGLGQKKAERLCLELADRLDDVAVAAATSRSSAPGLEDAVAALVALGYGNAEAAAAVRKVVDDNGPRPSVELIRLALASIKK